MFKLNKDVILTPAIILKLVTEHQKKDLLRLEKLKRYYYADNNIHNRVYKDDTRPKNKIANGYASYITDTLVGYFMGNPVTYNSDNENLLKTIQEIFDYNDEADENTELAKSQSIYGISYERIYIDEESQIRFKIIPTVNCIPVYDDTIENNLLYFITYEKSYDIVKNERYYAIEVLDESNIYHYRTGENLGTLILEETEPHYFGIVPIAIYKNNEEELGDFERVIDLIDAYDGMESDTMNDFEYFTDAYLALYGYSFDTSEEGRAQIANMKEQRMLFMDEGTKAEWVVKNNSNMQTEDQKNRLDNDIHKFSFCPNMSDENFASNASGIAIKFKTLGTENLTAIKERKFKKGLQMRLEIISMVTSLLGAQFDWRDIGMTFTRNLPTNLNDIANMVKTLEDVVSRETLLAQLPFVEDVSKEMERIDKEKEDNPFYQNMQLYDGLKSEEDPVEEDADDEENASKLA